ncbi:hypothetical protein [Hyphococcus luteus]|uniref:Uncharacterized protein n=1 Tax=Hyphococcus luteus TaxID=2058213 RepID=A0A2S7KAJ9_9PROT|nr:hypothetical protein [Marinicaulis flavus]PQA89525.1 hypothetical protein CW354_01245 [Marinicaulis flavus]
MKSQATLLAVLMSLASAHAQEPPPLPAGLGSSSAETQDDKDEEQSGAPALPSGLGESQAPALPAGLSGEEQSETQLAEPDEPFEAPFGLTGFIEARAGVRIVSDPYEKQLSIGEVRAQLGRDIETRHATFHVVGDLYYDQVEDVSDVNLETGRGFFDLREANVLVRPLDFLDIKAGRQILTWGVGDLVFINDLFPKDYRSFFIGRDDEYLKAPSDAVRASVFNDIANVEFVYTPRFDADRSITGERLSYYNPALGRIAGRDAVINAMTPDDWFSDDEFAARAYRNIAGFEAALYGYMGYWKTPEGQTPLGTPFHPKLSVFGGSLRGPVKGGILTAEFGRYFSGDDKDGDNPFIRNGETRFLVGYEKEIANELTAAIQYNGEVISDYAALKSSLPPGASAPDRMRHVVTLRLTKLMLNQNLTLSGFNFWSPNEKDGYFRFRASYKLTDAWLAEAGGNIFYGADNNTFFGQFENNTNLFVGIRRNF